MEFCDIPQELFEFVIFINIVFKDVVCLAMTCKAIHTYISGMKYEKQVVYTSKMKYWFANLTNIKILSLDLAKDKDFILTLCNIRIVDLSHTQVTDVSWLGGVHTLDLNNTLVTDVSRLGGVHTLNLSRTRVTDVSSLGGVHTLNLRGTKVTDVSCLGRVHTLDLSRTQVTDVSALWRVHTLNLSGVSCLGKIHILKM